MVGTIRGAAILFALTVFCAFAQNAPPRPAFAVASIKPDDDPARSGILRPIAGGLTSTNMSVRSYLGSAWHLRDYQIYIPASLAATADSRYAINAKADGPATPEELMRMLQSLLIDRFHLAFHFEKRDLPVFALVVAKGGSKQLHDPVSGDSPHMDPSKTDGGQQWWFHNEPVSALIGIVSTGLDRPILDMTGIQGSFDFTFVLPVWNREEGLLGDYVISEVFPEIQRQLGLRVEAQTALIDVLIIDHIDKTPTDN